MTTSSTWATLLAAAVAFSQAGCQDDQISHNRIARAADPAQKAPATAPAMALAAPPPGAPSPAAPPGMAGDVPLPPRPTGAAKLAWTLPKGWTEEPGEGVRYATLKPPAKPASDGEGKLEVSVVVLGGPAGGETANANRWRSALGLPPLTEEALRAQRVALKTAIGTVALYDFTSEGTVKSRLVAGIAVSDDNSWFFKLTGEATAVGKAAPDFRALLESLRRPAAER